MPAISALTLNDGAAAPVAHTFVPVKTDGSTGSWAERTASGPTFWATLTNGLIVPQSKSSAEGKPLTNRWQVYVPVGVTPVGGATVLDHFSSASLNFYFSPRASEEERKNLVSYVKNLLANTTVYNAAVACEPFY